MLVTDHNRQADTVDITNEPTNLFIYFGGKLFLLLIFIFYF
jgi:hypothetical protein